MSKKKKKKSGLVYDPEAVRETKRQLRAFNWKRAAILAGTTLAAFAILEGGVAIEVQLRLRFSIIVPIYYIAATLLALAVIFFNHGFTKTDFTPDMLDQSLEPEEAEKICAKLNRHRAIAKKLMNFLFPILFAIMLDFLYLFWGDTVKTAFSVLLPK